MTAIVSCVAPFDTAVAALQPTQGAHSSPAENLPQTTNAPDRILAPIYRWFQNRKLRSRPEITLRFLKSDWSSGGVCPPCFTAKAQSHQEIRERLASDAPIPFRPLCLGVLVVKTDLSTPSQKQSCFGTTPWERRRMGLASAQSEQLTGGGEEPRSLLRGSSKEKAFWGLLPPNPHLRQSWRDCSAIPGEARNCLFRPSLLGPTACCRQHHLAFSRECLGYFKTSGR